MAVQGIAVALNVVLRSRAAQAAIAGLSTAIKGAQKVGQGLNFGMRVLSKGIGLVKKAAFGAGVALAGMFATAWQSPALAAGIDKIKVALLEFGEIVAPILNRVIDFFLYAINAAKRFFQINRARIIELLDKIEPILQGIVDAFFDVGKIALETAHNIVDFIKESEGFQNVRTFIENVIESLRNGKDAWITLFTTMGTKVLEIVDKVQEIINKILGIKQAAEDADLQGQFNGVQTTIENITTAVDKLGTALSTLVGYIGQMAGAWSNFKNSKIGGWIAGLLGLGGDATPPDFQGGSNVVSNAGPGQTSSLSDVPLGVSVVPSTMTPSTAPTSVKEAAEIEREKEKERKKREKERKKAEREAEQRRKREQTKETGKNIINTAIDYGKKAIDFGKKVVSGVGSFIGGLFGRADGGNISTTGPYLLHAGERVVPRQQVASGGMGNVSINITTGPVNSQVDLRNLATLISREIAKQNKYGRGSVSVN